MILAPCAMIRRTIFTALLAMTAGLCWAQQPAPLLTDIEDRHATSLDGAWHAIVDMYDTGYVQYQTMQPSGTGFFRNEKPQNKHDLVEYDFDHSETLNVPGDWNSQRESLLFYEGTIWYEKSFSYRKKANTRVFLYLGAANYVSRVGVNGTVLCSHEGGFTPFNCELTSVLHDGQNFVVIYVNNTRRRDAVPTLNTDWWNYGGLTRDVSLVEVPQRFIQDDLVQLRKGTRDQISGWVKLSESLAGQTVTIKIPELSIEKTFHTGQNGVAEFSIPAPQLRLWSPDQPKLYSVEVDSDTDKLQEQIGFRSIEVRGRDILLNGSPIFLRGVDIHEEAPYRPGRAYSEEDAQTLLGWAKDLGANFVRLAHYPHNEHMLRLADRLGLMVWSEVPVYWGIEWENPATLANAENQLTESIMRDKNLASIVIWSVANETPVSEARMRFLGNMVRTARTLDSTRLISAALQIHHHDGTTRVLDDPLGAELDVLGCNEYIGWYEGVPEDADEASWQTPYDKPLIMSEFGGEALSGFHADADTRFSEEYQERLYRHQIQMLDRISFLRGTSAWVLMDFRSPRRLLPGIQDYYNRKGLISKQGERKKAFYVLQKWYQQKK
jgi:beta-glucuronidase